MADIKLNFSSQWPTIQVAKVIASPATAGDADTYPYIRKIKHNLGYPPLAIGMAAPNGAASYNVMVGLDVDDTYVYINDYAQTQTQLLECAVVYALDISKGFDYSQYTSQVGDVVRDTSGGTLDLRKFLLHSRAVGPMVLSVTTKKYTVSDQLLTYISPLNYATFQFGYVHLVQSQGIQRAGIWRNAPLASQAWPWLNSDGFTSKLATSIINGQYDSNFMYIPGTGEVMADIGSIITLRNPAVITSNAVTVNI